MGAAKARALSTRWNTVAATASPRTRPRRRTVATCMATNRNPPGRCGLLPERVMDDPARLRSSVRTFLDLDFDTLLVGDGESIFRDAKARLEELTETFPDWIR